MCLVVGVESPVYSTHPQTSTQKAHFPTRKESCVTCLLAENYEKKLT